jgi:S-adenosylmethionine hydrolase
VGTDRRVVYAEVAGGKRFLAPDNGLLTQVLKLAPHKRLMTMNRPETWNRSISNTFHGRDIFAPIAAQLSLGIPAEQLGEPLEDIVRIDIPEAELAGDRLRGQVLIGDSFGNLITNIQESQVQALGPPQELRVICNDRSILGVDRVYADKAPGELIALMDSQDRLEIATVNGNAAKTLGALQGTSVVVERRARP